MRTPTRMKNRAAQVCAIARGLDEPKRVYKRVAGFSPMRLVCRANLISKPSHWISQLTKFALEQQLKLYIRIGLHKEGLPMF
ncbi:hypothetical protein TB1_005637 [Malus domestica]